MYEMFGILEKLYRMTMCEKVKVESLTTIYLTFKSRRTLNCLEKSYLLRYLMMKVMEVCLYIMLLGLFGIIESISREIVLEWKDIHVEAVDNIDNIEKKIDNLEDDPKLQDDLIFLNILIMFFDFDMFYNEVLYETIQVDGQ
jgi:hypothetical protein